MKPQDTPVADAQSGQTPARRAYQKPELQVYGDLAEITKTVASMTNPDGQGHPNKHFTS